MHRFPPFFFRNMKKDLTSKFTSNRSPRQGFLWNQALKVNDHILITFLLQIDQKNHRIRNSVGFLILNSDRERRRIE